MNYLVGDVQGCADALERMLAEIGFSPSRDRLVLVGDLVNRGPASLAVLRRVAAFGDAATCLLGNHDLHLLAVAHGVRRHHRKDTLAPLLQAPDAPALLEAAPPATGTLGPRMAAGVRRCAAAVDGGHHAGPVSRI